MTKLVPKNGAAIPDSEHVLRYLRPRHVENGVVNGEGFLTRPGEDAPSVNWLEWFDPPIENQVKGVRSITRLTYAKTGQLARLNVGQTKSYVRENDPNGLSLSFIHAPLDPEGAYPSDPSHSLIEGVPIQDKPEAALVKDLIANCVLEPLYPAVPPAEPGNI
jgi:hypothetical protein